MIYQNEFKYFTNACLVLTDACNLSCKYCFVNQHPHYMNLEIATKSIDFLVQNYKNKENKPEDIVVNLFGGEPMLMWDSIIVPLTNYVEKYYKGLVHLVMTTNGLLLNEERMAFLQQHNIRYILSMDGDKESQSLRCKKDMSSSFNELDNKLELMLQYQSDIIYRMTMNPNYEQYLFQNFLYLNKKGFNVFSIYPNCRWEWNENNFNILNDELDKIFAYYLLAFENNSFPPIWIQMERIIIQILEHDLMVYKNNLSEIDFERHPCSTCGTGCKSAAINFDGKIYTCQEQVTRDKDNIFNIGDIDNGIDIVKHKHFLSMYCKKAKIINEEKELCQNCRLRHTCLDNTLCLSMNYDLSNNFFIKKKIDCIWQQSLMDRTIKLINYLMLTDNQLFKKYIFSYFNNNNFEVKISHKHFELQNNFDEILKLFKSLNLDNNVIFGKYNFCLSEIRDLTKQIG